MAQATQTPSNASKTLSEKTLNENKTVAEQIADSARRRRQRTDEMQLPKAEMQRIEQNPDALIVNIEQVFLNPNNSRKTITPRLEKKIDDIAQSMKQTDIGMLQPILVRRRKWGPSEIPQYEDIAGDCRLMAAQRAGLTKVPVIVKNVDDRTARRINLIENIHRSNIEDADMGESLIELKADMQAELSEYLEKFAKNAPQQKLNAATYEKMKKDLLNRPAWIGRVLDRYENSSKKPKVSWDDVAGEVGWSDARSVHYYIAISKLPEQVLALMADDLISQHQARAIAQLKTEDEQIAFANRIISEGLSGPDAAKATKTENGSAPSTKGALHPTTPAPTPMESAISKARNITSQIAQLRRELEGLQNGKGEFSEKFRQDIDRELQLWGQNGEGIVAVVKPFKESLNDSKQQTTKTRKVRFAS